MEHHAADKEIAVRKETAAEIAAEEMQTVVKGAEHTHQRRGCFHAELQMLRRVKDERRVENSEAERREDLNEEQRGRSLWGCGETAGQKFHSVLFCRSAGRAMSSLR